MTDTSRRRAQAGIGTLVVFVTMVLVASIAAGVLVNSVWVDREPGESGTGQGAATAPEGLLVIAQTGTAGEDGRVGVANLTVTAAPGTDPIDLRDATVTWVGPGGAANVASRTGTGGSGDGTFAVTALRDPDGSAPVLDGPDDRFVLTFDLGETDDVPGVESIGSRLGPGDMVRVTITTGDGRRTTTRLAVPRSPVGTDLVL